MKSQHDKGPEFERKICGVLSEWLTKGEIKDLFHRNVLSGGQYTQSAKIIHDQVNCDNICTYKECLCSCHIQIKKIRGTPGDLAAAHPIGYDFCNVFVTECKHWRDLQISQFLVGKGELYEALVKVREQALKTKKEWLLIVRQNRQPIFVFFPVLRRPLFSWWTNADPVHYFFLGNNPCYMVQLDHLLKYDPEELLSAARGGYEEVLSSK